ncbi:MULTISPECIES: TRAP transporter small permease subunit [Halopseudomonas]|jgi:TRAP-type mannitol/chloroaromatic compound transport system permease small subunit|uniref:TRAP transporter small permease subunit n=1 Tax=Halopseudomonas TaxID=2901189 RepID=UPI0022B6E00F|nr:MULTISPECIES: TRAP transporter small permease subunit [Halopseudomonas]BDX18317.1 C4-dicarboxylate ABC transporter substrate-binding protein [Halopseudomonas aestusnigri]GMQ52342.1 TRAP transporter small permease subunit [Halopseudomonas aestusnigri]
MFQRLTATGLSLACLIDRATSLLGRSVAWLTLLMVLLTCAVVLLRYGFDIGATATQELILYAHSLVFLGAAAWALQRDAHVRVDIFFRRLQQRGKALVDLTGSLLFLLPMCLFLAYNCWDYVGMSWQRQERSADAGGLPWVYLHKSLILLLVASLLLQAVAQILKTLAVLSGVRPGHLPASHEEHL